MTTLGEPVGLEHDAQGSASAPVTLVLYGDDECPATSREWPTVTVPEERPGNRLRLAFQTFSLGAIHPRKGLTRAPG